MVKKHCHHCNLDFPDNRKFCEFCGNRLVDLPQGTTGAIVCPNCGTPVESQWKFCKNCRARLVALTASLASNTPQFQPARQPNATAALTAAPTVSLASAPQPQIATQRIVVRCRSCKNLVDEDSVFCEFCGANMIEDGPAQSQLEPTPLSTTVDESPITPSEEAEVERAGSVQACSDPMQVVAEPSLGRGSPPVPIHSSHEAFEETVWTSAASSTPSTDDESLNEAAVTTAAAPHCSPDNFDSGHEAAAKSRWPIIVAALFILVVVATTLGFGGWFWWARRSAAARARQITPVRPAPATRSSPEGMVYVKGGNFQMGRNDGDEYERPAHDVVVSPFYIDKYEVNCEQYQKFIEATHRSAPQSWRDGAFPPGAERLPVTGVTWDDAKAYAEWDGKRLPTEEEWEFAARGNDGRRYPWGNDWKPNAANSGDSSANKLVAVGSYPIGESPYGALDMIGNAWEWTGSDLAVYPGGRLPSQPASNSKVIRGGSWKEEKDQATTTYRGFLAATGAKDYSATGFRCVQDVRSGPSH